MKIALKKRLLLVDFVETTRLMLEHFLGDEFDIIHKKDGAEAWHFLQSGASIDFMITEINLPKLNGKQLIQQLRQQSQYQHLPIILLTGTNELQDCIECINLGADNFVNKPFNPFEIQARINTFLKLQQRRLYKQVS